MKNVLFSALAMVTFLAGGELMAQSTGPSMLGAIREDFSNRPGYTVESTPTSLVLRDAATGNELFSVSENATQSIMLRSTVGTTAPREDRHIADFNTSSAVGTLIVNRSTGRVEMEHYVNSRLVSASALIAVANRFDRAVRAEKAALAIH